MTNSTKLGCVTVKGPKVDADFRKIDGEYFEETIVVDFINDKLKKQVQDEINHMSQFTQVGISAAWCITECCYKKLGCLVTSANDDKFEDIMDREVVISFPENDNIIGEADVRIDDPPSPKKSKKDKRMSVKTAIHK
jgi:hypothetical protein